MIKNDIPTLRERTTVLTLKNKKAGGEKVSLLSIYDFPFAQLAERAGLDVIIVGDSLGMTILGYKNTLPVTMDEMISHAAAVRRGTENIFVVGDMPFLSYQESDSEAIRNAGRFIKEAGCEAVKCEASKHLISRIKAITDSEILVMGHIGLNPHKIHEMGGYRIQGRTVDSAVELLETAIALEKAGIFALLVEGATEEVTSLIRDHLHIPVYGIGSGRYVDGHLLIGHDLLELYYGFTKLPTYIKRYFPKSKGSKTVGQMIFEVFSDYVSDVKNGRYPTKANVHRIDPQEFKIILKKLSDANKSSISSTFNK